MTGGQFRRGLAHARHCGKQCSAEPFGTSPGIDKRNGHTGFKQQCRAAPNALGKFDAGTFRFAEAGFHGEKIVDWCRLQELALHPAHHKARHPCALMMGDAE